MARVEIKIPDWLDRVCAWPVMVYRKYKYGWPFRRIYLGEGKWTILDQEDYSRLNKHKWYVNGNGFEFYAFRNVIVGPGKTRMLSMHREIMNFPKGLLVDHRNHITLDNRQSNLREATHSENTCNKQRKRAGCSSEFRGVSFDKKREYWNVQVVKDGKMVFFGRYKDEVEAAKAYDAAAKKYHGEFARLNFPEEN